MKHPLKYQRRSEKQIRALLTNQEKGDLSLTAFCEIHRIRKNTFHNWRNKYELQREPAPQFIPVQLGQAETSPALFGEIEFPSRVVVRLYQQVDASWIKSLLP